MENSKITVEEKIVKKNNYFLLFIPLLLIAIFLVLFFFNNQKVEDKTTKELAINTNELLPTPLPEKKSTGLGYPVVRVTKHNYQGWKEYKSIKGNLAIYYPTNWFVDESTVFSWNPKSVERPLPLKNKDSKWDMDLIYNNDVMPEYIQDAFDIGTSEQNYHLFEVTKTIDGWPVYIGTVEAAKADPESLLSGHDYLVAIIITPDGWLSWHGFAGTDSDNNGEVLKQIVESLHYSK